MVLRYSTKVTPLLPGSGSSALSLPIRLLFPPARMIPVIWSNITMSCVAPGVIFTALKKGGRLLHSVKVQFLARRGCFALATLGNILLAILIGTVVCLLLWILAYQRSEEHTSELQ